MQLKVQGIILKQRNIGENDRILTILTPDLGMIEASAKNVKSTKSSISAACQILSYSDICLYKGKGNYFINSAETVNSFYSLRFDVIKLALASYFCELTTYLSPTNDNSNDYLKLLLNTLHFLQNTDKDEGLLKAIFEFRLMSIAGFTPNLVCCKECSVFENDLMYFLPLDGVLFCEGCYIRLQLGSKNKIKFDVFPPVLAALRHIVYSKINKLFSFNLVGDSLLQLCVITENYVLLHTEGKFKSLDIYKSLQI